MTSSAVAAHSAAAVSARERRRWPGSCSPSIAATPAMTGRAAASLAIIRSTRSETSSGTGSASCRRAGGQRDLAGDVERLAQRQPLGVSLEALEQRLALEELHDQVGRALGELAVVDDLDDARVADAVDRARLVDEAGGEVGVRRELR